MMEDSNHRDDLDGLVKIVKSDIKNHVRLKMIQTNPDWMDLITRKLILDTLIFIDGFGSCLKEYVSPPYNKEEVQEFLKGEAFRYVYRRIEEQYGSK